MFENLSERLERSFKLLKGEGKITEINVAETLKDVRRALLDADVNFKVAKQFTDTVKQKALGKNVLTSVKPGQLMVKIVHDELTQLMGGQAGELKLSSRPSVILMAGLNGAGKTTLSGKLALLLKNKKSRKPLLVACDVYRPAAIDQLKIVGEAANIPVFSMGAKISPVEIAKAGVEYAKKKGLKISAIVINNYPEGTKDIAIKTAPMIIQKLSGVDYVPIVAKNKNPFGMGGIEIVKSSINTDRLFDKK